MRVFKTFGFQVEWESSQEWQQSLRYGRKYELVRLHTGRNYTSPGLQENVWY